MARRQGSRLLRSKRPGSQTPPKLFGSNGHFVREINPSTPVQPLALFYGQLSPKDDTYKEDEKDF